MPGEMMSRTYLIIGGARSGKSSYGEELAASLDGKVGYLATAKVTDPEMEKRVIQHRKRRPKGWMTFELENTRPDKGEIDRIISELEKNNIGTLLIDCTTNLLFRLLDEYRFDHLEVISNEMEVKIETEVLEIFSYLLKKLSSRNMDTIIISNEIGMGVVPAFPLGRLFRDLMGMVNKELASAADEVYLFTAGLKQRLK
jgi:adenosylcobinamide kinase/adenosylcobinamide-phosphate guanylyltransferase